MIVSRALLQLVFVVGLVGCDTQVWDFDAGAGSSGRRGDAVEPDAATASCEAGVCVCAANQLQCNEACVDPSSSSQHCGGCGKACAEGERCREARCECLADQTRCGAICANIQINVLHCGACNQPCAGNQQCQGGHCM